MKTYFDVPPSFDLRHNPMGPAIDKAEEIGGHVVYLDGKYQAVSDATLMFRKLESLYRAGDGFRFELSTKEDEYDSEPDAA